MRRLLQLGANPSGVGEPLPGPAPKPYCPLSAAVLTGGGDERAVAAAPAIVKLLLVRPAAQRACGGARCWEAAPAAVPGGEGLRAIEHTALHVLRCACSALQAAGADPLAPSVRRRCSTLRCACGSEFLKNGEHLQGGWLLTACGWLHAACCALLPACGCT